MQNDNKEVTPTLPDEKQIASREKEGLRYLITYLVPSDRALLIQALTNQTMMMKALLLMAQSQFTKEDVSKLAKDVALALEVSRVIQTDAIKNDEVYQWRK